MKAKLLILFIFLLIASSALASDTPKHPKKPFSQLRPMLEPIVHDAIMMGEGPVDVYVFVDPQCPRSQEFVAFIAESEKMRSRYRYHFYLYELERFHSGEIIGAIYSAPSPRQAMIAHMAQAQPLAPGQTGKAALERMARIKKAAEQIGVYKRPYLILNKPLKSARKQ